MGTILINIGYGTTNMIAYSQGSPIYTGGVAFGGDSITNDLAYILNKPKQVAEQIKCESGSCYVPSVPSSDMILIPQVGGMPSIRMPRRSLCEIIEPRMAEIFTLLAMELEKVEHQGSFGGGVVLVGGGSLLSGVTELASEIFKLPQPEIHHCPRSAQERGQEDSHILFLEWPEREGEVFPGRQAQGVLRQAVLGDETYGIRNFRH